MNCQIQLSIIPLGKSSAVPGSVHFSDFLPIEEVQDRLKFFEWLWAKLYGDEPIFIVRGQDMLGPVTINQWLHDAENLGTPPECLEEVKELLRKMHEWQAVHQDKVKIPD